MTAPLPFHSFRRSVVLAFLVLSGGVAGKAAGPATPSPAATAPDEFNDPLTGARIVRLSTLPNRAAGVIYFTQNCITPDSRYAVVRYLAPSAGHTAGHMYRYEFASRQLVLLTDRMTKNQVLVPRSANLYYTSDADRAIYCTNIRSLKTRKVADLPPAILCSGGLTVNADETLVVGTGYLASEHVNEPILTTAPNHGKFFANTFKRHYTNLLIGVGVRTGKFTELHRINTWLGHVQFSPTDPALLMYCHEGPGEKLDRIWTLRIGDGSAPQLMLKRTEAKELAGHEFWSPDGTVIWYDHIFRGKPGRRFLEGRNVATGAVTRYPIVRSIGSVHYAPSPDGRFFVADGAKVARHRDRQAMFLLVPEGGRLRPVKLCSMAHNDYRAAEPNPHLTPDQRRVLFTATFTGTPQAYAVDVPRAFWR